MLAGNVRPDRGTISSLRRRHRRELFVQTGRLPHEAGLVRLGHLAPDGAKAQTNASQHSAQSYGYMKQERERLRAEILQELQATVAADAHADHQPGRGCRRSRSTACSPTGGVRAERQVPAEPADRAQHNSEPASRILLTSRKAFQQGYHAQIAVDAEHRMTLAAELTNQAADAPQLIGLLDQAIQNTGELPAKPWADAARLHGGRSES